MRRDGYDVVVIGAGLVGGAIAYGLARAGQRVAVLDEHTAGTGLFQGVRCAFAVANYWTYGYFEPRDHCELPGLLLRTRASADAPHAFFAPGFEGQPYRYRPSELPAYVSWTVELPSGQGAAGRPALVGINQPAATGSGTTPHRRIRRLRASPQRRPTSQQLHGSQTGVQADCLRRRQSRSDKTAR